MRVPWLGHIVLFMRNSVGLPIIIALIILLVVVEFIVPLIRGKKASTVEPEQEKEAQKQP